jgi:Cu2+-exporting ATPase
MDHQMYSDTEHGGAEHRAHHSSAEPVAEQQTHAHHEMQMHAEYEDHSKEMDHPAQDMHAEHGMSQTSKGAEHSASHDEHGDHTESHADHSAHVDHTGHEQMFRQRFWVCLALSIPVLLYSPMIQEWLGFSMPAFPGSQWITPAFSVIVFLYGGVPFLQMAQPEIKNRRPGMMTLISLAISVAFFYSLAALFLPTESSFFWELVTLIDIMLLGHWLEMRSVRQASGALSELAKLMPDTAERISGDGSTVEVQVSQLRNGDLVLVRPGASVPADGDVQDGESDVN